ncbi:MAG: FlgD immunoglobulin-like domain containing protein [Rhodothermales bacterium]
MEKTSVRLAALVVVLAVCPAAFAQITVTNATFPAAGDTLRMAIDDAPDAAVVVVSPPGFDLVWDYSGLQVDSTYAIIFRPAGEGNAEVPDAELFTVFAPALERYYNVTEDRIEVTADYGTPLDLFVPSLFQYNPPLGDRYAPLNFFDTRASSSGILYAEAPEAFTPALVASLRQFIQPDSLRYRIAINQLQAVDAFGALTIPGGTYTVLREKQTRFTETRIDAKIPPLGWLDVTDIAKLMAGFRGLGVDTTTTYRFFNDMVKEPIAVLHAGPDPLRVLQAEFTYMPPTGTGRQRPTSGLPEGYVLHTSYPNPFRSQTTVSYDVPEQAEVRVEIYNALGVSVRSLEEGAVSPGRHRMVWDARDDAGRQVASGLYVVKMVAVGREGPVTVTRAVTLIR